MSQELVTPNLHVALVHFPIALLVIGTLIELFAFLWRRSGFRSAGRWMILLGALLAVPVTFSGIYAYRDVAGINNPNDYGTWAEIRAASPMSEMQWEMLWDHTWQQIVATQLAVLAVLVWIACSDRYRRRLHIPLMLVLLLANLFMLAGAWHGGEMVYRQGTALKLSPAASARLAGEESPSQTAAEHVSRIAQVVEPETVSSTTQPATAPAFTASTRPLDLSAATLPATLQTLDIAQPATQHAEAHADETPVIQRVFPPMQMHVIFAGLTISAALAALALSVRAWTSVQLAGSDVNLTAALDAPSPPGPIADIDDVQRAAGASAADLLAPLPSRVPATRFWLLAMFIAIATALLGDWMLASDIGSWQIHDLLEQIKLSARRTAHVILASAIIGSTIVLMILSRFAPRKRIAITAFALALLIAVGLQTLEGVLLLFDGVDGPWTRFK